MSRFLHTSIRLNCDLRKAYRLFTVNAELEKWFAKELVGNISENQSISGYFPEYDQKFENLKFESVISKETIQFRFPVQLTDQVSISDTQEFTVEIKFMQCTSETEYCTEIHLMQHGFKDSDESTEIRNIYLEFWKKKLENLRQMVNDNWVIQDSELTLRCLQ